MNETIHVETTYTYNISTPVELPEGKVVADIDEVWVKWGEIHVSFKDETEVTGSEGDFDPDKIDWKRPCSVEVRRDSNGYADWDSDPIISE